MTKNFLFLVEDGSFGHGIQSSITNGLFDFVRFTENSMSYYFDEDDEETDGFHTEYYKNPSSTWQDSAVFYFMMFLKKEGIEVDYVFVNTPYEDRFGGGGRKIVVYTYDESRIDFDHPLPYVVDEFIIDKLHDIFLNFNNSDLFKIDSDFEGSFKDRHLKFIEWYLKERI